MSLAHPYMLAIPFLLLALMVLFRRAPRAATYGDTSLLAALPISLRAVVRFPAYVTLLIAIFSLLAIAASDPQSSHVLRQDYKSRNIMIAMDLSKSMSFLDFASSSGIVSRITAVKDVTREFIDSRPQDRIGIAVFGTAAYLQSPLTLDHRMLHEMISRLDVGLAGDATAIGDGLGICLKRIAGVPSPSKAIILITDGVSNAGQVNPLKAAHVARDLGVKIHTIGVGASVHLDFDDETLKEIAQTTGGVFFNANDYEGLKQVYAEIDKLEQSTAKQPQQSYVEHHFAPFAIAGLLIYLLYMLLFQTILMKVP